jgi:hypothetical protein
MQNKYESPEVIQIGVAQCLILGAKRPGMYDDVNGDETTEVYDLVTDIDE